jgi:hypothetical protein
MPITRTDVIHDESGTIFGYNQLLKLRVIEVHLLLVYVTHANIA